VQLLRHRLGRSAIAFSSTFFVLVSLWLSQALGAEEPEDMNPEDKRILFDIEDPPELNYALGEQLSFGAELDTEFLYERNFDLDSSDNQDLARLTPELAVSFGLDLGPQVDAFLEIHLERGVDFRAPDDEPSQETKLIIDEVYLTFSEVVENLSFQVGRVRMRDRREWLFDQELDGVRAFLRLQPFGLELSVNREQLFDEDLLNGDSVTKIDNYLAVGRYRPDDVFAANAYVFHRDNRDQDSDDLTFVGLQSIADWPGGGGLWLDTAYVFGREEGTKIGGFGLDTGITLVPDTSFGLSGTLAFAFGSGDSDPDDGKDHAFRQSGLQENRDGFNGITRFSYYGEVLDPELSNLIILTAGLGVLPGDRTSLDLVYHRYWQHEASDSLREAAIDADPNGRRRHLGDEIDLVLGMSEIENLDIEAAVGAFFPGDAYSSDRDPAFVVRLEATIEF